MPFDPDLGIVPWDVDPDPQDPIEGHGWCRTPGGGWVNVWGGETIAVIPWDDGAVQAAFDHLEAVLGQVTLPQVQTRGMYAVRPNGRVFPSPWDTPLKALYAINQSMQGCWADRWAEPVGPGGERLRPWLFPATSVNELDLIGQAVRALGAALAACRAGVASPPDRQAAAVVDAYAADLGVTGEDLVTEAAQLHGLLSLSFDDDAHYLGEFVLGGEGPVVLDDAQHAAYQRVMGRIAGIWRGHLPEYPGA